MRFTDLSCSNIFINDSFEIISIPDMEWCCALPTEMQHPPLWLGGCDIDDYEGSKKTELEATLDYFAMTVQLEDRNNVLTTILRSILDARTYWYMACLSDHRAVYNLYVQHLQPEFAPDHVLGAKIRAIRDSEETL